LQIWVIIEAFTEAFVEVAADIAVDIAVEVLVEATSGIELDLNCSSGDL
jgi:hypothetical protein